MQWRGWERVAAAGYLSILAVTVVLERYANYLWFEQPVLWGQSLNILLMFVGFGVAGLLWLAAPQEERANTPLKVFLIAMALAWVVHWALFRYHSDAMNYTAILYVPILLMLYLKPPTWLQAKIALIAFAWTTTVVLVLTRVLEMVGALEVKAQPQGVIDFDTERYFLPLNDLMGIEGRWPGPFGHNGDTAMMGALILIIGIAFWSRSSWAFITVGAATLLLTNGRASMGATIAGLVILIMFTNHGFFARYSRTIRITIGSILLVLGALVMYLRPAGLTGRERIWPAFLDLWFSSPLLGVGSRGIANGDEVTSLFLHAHSLYIDELARYGLVGFLSQFGALAIGVGIAAVVAWRGYPAPLTVLTAYLVTGITEPRNTWIAPSATGFLVILMVLAASAKLRHTTDETEDLGEEPALAFNRDGQDQQGAREPTD